jgi:hypothetical protein
MAKPAQSGLRTALAGLIGNVLESSTEYSIRRPSASPSPK